MNYLLAALAVAIFAVSVKILDKGGKFEKAITTEEEFHRSWRNYMVRLSVGYALMTLAVEIAIASSPPWAWKNPVLIGSSLFFVIISVISTWAGHVDLRRRVFCETDYSDD